MEDSVLMHSRQGTPPSDILDRLRRQSERSPSPEAVPPVSPDGQPWPDENAEYQAAGRNAAHAVETVFFLTRGRMPRGFAYANLEEVVMRENDKPGQGPLLVARFAGSRVMEVVIEGRGLLSVCNDLGRRVVPWLWELPTGKDYKDEETTVITKIDFQEKK